MVDHDFFWGYASVKFARNVEAYVGYSTALAECAGTSRQLLLKVPSGFVSPGWFVGQGRMWTKLTFRENQWEKLVGWHGCVQSSGNACELPSVAVVIYPVNVS